MFSAATKTGSQPSAAANYIEDVFSTYLFTGTGGAQAIPNGVNLADYGGLVWCKKRNASESHYLIDTVRGSNYLSSNTTGAQASASTGLTYQTDGFSLTSGWYWNTSSNVASWTFRKQPKFFDVVTFTNTNNTNQRVSHSLDSVPGMIFIKCTDTSEDWPVYHRSLGRSKLLVLDGTTNSLSVTNYWGTSDPTSTDFGINSQNLSGTNYVAYLFAHDAGGFGESGTDNVISCGSFTTDSSGNASVNLGYEPQYLMFKASSTGQNWFELDVMRGWSQTQSYLLNPNTSDAETPYEDTLSYLYPTATGFVLNNTAGIWRSNATYIYMAIRRPMKVPTDATTVFSPQIWTGNSTKRSILGPTFPVDAVFIRDRSSATGYSFVNQSRLVGPGNELQTWNTSSEFTGLATDPSGCLLTFNQSGITLGTDAPNHGYNVSSNPEVGEFFVRRPGFFDVVCYTGTGSATTQAHNLTVAPELMIVKKRSSASGSNWCVYSAPTGNTNYLYLNTTDAVATFNLWNDTTPTSSVFSLSGSGTQVNGSGATYVAYLFATCTGVSKVGSYTGDGTDGRVINCGFTGGARFVLIKVTSTTGSWYVWDTARGMVSGTDPSLRFNSTAAEVNANNVFTTTTGFSVDASGSLALNTSGNSYIFLAIA